MYESPINVIIDNFSSDIRKKEENYIMECVHNVGVDVNEEELAKALQYDRQQYDKGYKDGYNDGINKVSEDFQKVIEIVFSNVFPEDKEDELEELLQEYR